MYLCIFLIAMCLANVKAKSFIEADYNRNVSSETNFFKESEILSAVTASDHKCEGVCLENLQKADPQCKKGQGLVPSNLLSDPYCKDCECRNDNNCSFNRGVYGGINKKCVCEAGYQEKKGVCVGTCISNPCQNKGDCVVDGQDIECKCKGQFTGSRCERKPVDVVECPLDFDKCSNTNGQCVKEIESDRIKCLCPEDAAFIPEYGCTVTCPANLDKCENTNGHCVIGKHDSVKKCVCPAGADYNMKYGCVVTCPAVFDKCENTNGRCVKGKGPISEKCVCPTGAYYSWPFGCVVACPGGFEKCVNTDGHCVKGKGDSVEKCVCYYWADYNTEYGCVVACPENLDKCESTNGHCVGERFSSVKKCVCPTGADYNTEYGCAEISTTLPLDATTATLQTGIATTYLPDTQTTTAFSYTEIASTSDSPGTKTTITKSPDTDATTVVIDLCVTKPCKNGGMCRMEDEKYICYCPSPFTGKQCEMDPCSNDPCRNGGTCFLDGDSFRCICREPFAGNTCEADPCTWNPCKSGGICKLVNNSARCFCDSPYTGEYCEYVKGMGLTLIMFIVLSSLLILILVLVSCILCQRIRATKSS